MDKKTVFVKTKEGEEAMRQRTRLVQRNLRSILIMVDGKATVADLSKRFGDQNAAQAALAELLAGGYIAEQLDQLDFTKAQPPEAKKEPAEDVPELTSQIAPPPAQDPPSATPPAAEPPPLPPEIEEIELTAPEYESLPPPPLRPATPPKPVPPVAAGPGWMDRIKALFAKSKKAERPAAPVRKEKAKEEEYEEESIGGADLEPIRRERRFNFSWPVLGLFAVVGIAVLLGLTLLLYPYGRHLPDIERNASAMLQDPVKVGDIGFSFLPRPHIALYNITVGKDEANLSIGSVRAVPDFLSLMGDKKVFHELTFSKVAVKEAGLGKLAMAAASRTPVDIRHITLNDLSLAAGDAQIGGINGEVKLTAGAVEVIQLRNADGTLKVDLQPQGGAYRFAASGNAWKLPFQPSLTIQWLEAQGELQPGRLELGKIDARAYEGVVEGKASLGWAGGATLASELELKRLSAAKLLTALGSDLTADGDLSVRLKLGAKADSLGKLSEALHADGTFEMKRGTAKGFDLGEAVRARGPTRGGETKFEQLSGSVEIDPQDCRLGNLRLASGLLSAGGNIGIARKGPLSGSMQVELKSSAATLRMPLTVGGTTKDPMLTPSRR